MMGLETGELVALASSAVFIAGAYMAISQWTKMVRYGAKIDTPRWQWFAAENGLEFVDAHHRPMIRGPYKGASIQATTFITERRMTTRAGIQQKRKFARTELYVSIRAETPPGLAIAKKTVFSSIAALLLGGRAVPIDDELDELVRIESKSPTKTLEMFADPAVRAAVISLFQTVPDVMVHSRGVVVRLPGMLSDTTYLDLYLSKMAALATAMQAFAPPVDRVGTEEGAPPRVLKTAAELPPLRRSLHSALGSVRTKSAVGHSTLKMQPLEYEIEVRTVVEDVSVAGIATGGMLVRGLVSRSTWRVELSFGAEFNEAVQELKMGDVISGMLEVDDVRPTSHTVEATSVTPPIPMPPKP